MKAIKSMIATYDSMDELKDIMLNEIREIHKEK